ncbi:MAG: hypothetical protein GF416_08010 [Candidatus Altiarchaeales archaeon]|nr:hypothetical protein [Candidatus Altiarchaeales archaeon]MBD3417058.1 hypothetical protein [Candidatus Altiarchaeales archaeon]
MRPYYALALLILTAGAAVAQEYATIQGYVRDGNSGESIEGLKVDVYRSDDHSNTIAATKTDERGFYAVDVPPGSYYDVYLRVGDTNPNQRTSEAAAANAVYPLNFNIASESNYTDVVVERYGFWIVAAVAALVIAVIVLDQVFLKKSEKEPSLEELRKERDQITGMISMIKSKYHRREIDEESYREINRDEQKKLIEIEARIREKEGK